MKKIYLLLLTNLFFLPLWAQGGKEIDSEWKHQINTVFQNLEMERVPHGVLLDYAMEFTDVTAYGTPELLDNNRVDIDIFSNIYKTLYMGMTAPDPVSFPPIENIAATWAQERLGRNDSIKNTLVLSGLFYQYSKIRPDAVQTGDIIVDGQQFYDAYENGVWQNPYETKSTFAVSFPIQNYNKRNFKVVLPQGLWLTNQRGLVNHIEVDMDDGQGFRPLPFGQELQVHYPENGTYHWVFKVLLNNGSTLFSHTAVAIVVAAEQPDEEIFLYTDDFNGAHLRIDYAPGHTGLVKPFIIAEGFDPGNILEPETEGGQNTFNDFILEVEETDSEFDYLVTGNSQEYDLVYIDWYNGTAALQDNSLVLEKVLDYVNLVKTGNEQNVFLGQSMGGVIGRYTLARMEQENKTHDVRLFISHDAPLQGSNTPLGVQFFSRHFLDTYAETPILHFIGENLVPIGFGLAELISDVINGVFNGNTTVLPYVSPEEALGVQDTPAAVQMNYEWVHPVTKEVIRSIHQTWQQEFDSKGYPQNSRNIAISNGNECAEDHGFTAGAYLLEVDDVDNPDFWGDIVHMIGVPLAALVNGDFGLFLIGLIPGNSEWHYDFDIESVPALSSNNRRVYYGRIRYVKHFLWWDISHNITSRANTAPATSLPYGSYAGGSYDINNAIGQLPSQAPPIDIVNERYGFIPVVSALDVERNNDDVNPNDYYKSYAGGQINYSNLDTEFDNFIVHYTQGSPVNAPHISFSTRNGNWLAKELEANASDPDYPPVADCSFVCDDVMEINGSSALCDTATYNIASSGNGLFVNWYITEGSHLATLTNMGNSVTLTAIPGDTGYMTLKANVGSNFCDRNITKTKRIFVGEPEVGVTRLYAEEYCDIKYHYLMFRANSTSDYVSYDWFYPISLPGAQFYDYGETFKVGIPKNNYANFTIGVTVANSCGDDSGSWSGEIVQCNNNNYNNMPASEDISITPNPVNAGTLNVQMPESEAMTNSAILNEVNIYDLSGNLEFTNTYSGSSFNITNLNLGQGSYILNVTTSENTSYQQLILVE